MLDYVGVESSNGYQTRGQEVVDVIIANNFRYLQDMYQIDVNSASRRQPLDLTARIINPCFNSNMLQGWLGDGFGAVNPKENAEHFNRNFNTYQTITGLPNGVYAIGVKAFYRCGQAEEANAHYRIKDLALRNARLYAASGRDTLSFPLVSPFSKSVVKAKGVGREIGVKHGSLTYYIPDDMISAEYYMHELKAYSNVIFVSVTNHTLTFGVQKKQGIEWDWCMFDDFTLTYYGNQSEVYPFWFSEMKKRKLSYAGITVSNSYKEAYDEAYNATVNTRIQAIRAMKVIDTASENIAINAGLWAEYKQAGAEAQEVLGSDKYSDQAKAYLNTYYVTCYQRNLTDLELTNEQLPWYTDELRAYINQVCTGEWVGITSPNEDGNPFSVGTQAELYDLSGRQIVNCKLHGLYIQRATDGTLRKVLR